MQDNDELLSGFSEPPLSAQTVPQAMIILDDVDYKILEFWDILG